MFWLLLNNERDCYPGDLVSTSPGEDKGEKNPWTL